MSRVTKRKHVLKEMMNDDFELPKSNQLIVQVIGSRGNNLHEVESSELITSTTTTSTDDQQSPPPSLAQQQRFLVSMPTKFRKNVWVKRGDYLIIEKIEEGDKVKGEIVKILSNEHIKEYTKCGIWPKKFTKKRDHDCVDDDDDDDDSDNGDLIRNVNHPNIGHHNESSSTTDEDDIKDINTFH